MDSRLRALKISLVLLVLVVAFASCSKAQITFSRDWLAGSGKRSGQVTFSRDWLAGSGKRSAHSLFDQSGPASPAAAAATAPPRQAIQVLIDYLEDQLQDAALAKQSFINYMQQQHQEI